RAEVRRLLGRACGPALHAGMPPAQVRVRGGLRAGRDVLEAVRARGRLAGAAAAHAGGGGLGRASRGPSRRLARRRSAERDVLAIARFVRAAEDPATAEVAVAVTDEWQRRGLGTALLQDLAARARQEGITRYSAPVLADNNAMLEFARKLGDVEVTAVEDGIVHLLMAVPDEGIGEGLTQTVRAVARGDLRPRHRYRGGG